MAVGSMPLFVTDRENATSKALLVGSSLLKKFSWNKKSLATSLLADSVGGMYRTQLRAPVIVPVEVIVPLRGTEAVVCL